MEKVLQNKALVLKIEESGDELKVSWEGRSTERDPSIFLTPVFNDLIEKNKKIVLDFKKLEYMNSSTVTPLLKALDRLKNSSGKILIIYDRNLKWQQLSFSALEIFGTNDKRIQITGE